MKKFVIVSLLSMFVAAPVFAEEIKGEVPCVSVTGKKDSNKGEATGGGTPAQQSGSSTAGSANGGSTGEKKDK